MSATGLVLSTDQSDSKIVDIYTKGEHKSHLVSAWLPIRRINALRQMRTTFDPEELRSLADSITVQHLLHPLVVAQFTSEQALEHLRVINRAWGTHYTINDLKATETEEGLFYFILAAGERRLRAVLWLWEKGCEAHREEYSPQPVPEGFCYISHFGDDRIPVRIRTDATPDIVLTVQLVENTAVLPLPHETAMAFSEYHPIWQVFNPKTTLKDFAKQVNRSSSTVSDYLRYAKLPESIHEEVKQGLIPFGIAVEISRLHEDGMGEEELGYWVLKAKAGNFPIPDFREMVSNTLKERHSGQTSMWDMMTANAVAAANMQDIRLILERQQSRGWHVAIGVRKRVIALVRDGKLGFRDSPFSSRSVVRQMRIDLELAREENELLKHLLGAEGYQQATEILAERDSLTLQLFERAERE